MLRTTTGLLLFGFVLGIPVSSAFAQEPEKQPEQDKTQAPKFVPLPPEQDKTQAPKFVPPPPTVIEPYVIRPAPRDVWQHYGVSSLGRFAPRVIMTPYGDFYSRDLEPYPWTMNRATAIRP